MRVGVWLRAARAPFLTAVAVPVVVGAASGLSESGAFSRGLFLLALLGSLLMHAGANLINEHGDHLSGADAAAAHTPLSGGSGVIQEGLLAPSRVLAGAALCLGGGAALGLYLNSVTPGNVVLALGALGAFLAWSYSEKPLQLGYRGGGIGELTVALAFGPVAVIGSHYVQARAVHVSAVSASVPLALLIALVLFVNGFPDREADRSVGKRTLVVTLGTRRAVKAHRLLLGVVYAATAALVWVGAMPVWCLLAFLTAPLAFHSAALLGRAGGDAGLLARAGAATVTLHAGFGLLTAAGFVIDRLA